MKLATEMALRAAWREALYAGSTYSRRTTIRRIPEPATSEDIMSILRLFNGLSTMLCVQRG
jgi:hypothetical protein